MWHCSAKLKSLSVALFVFGAWIAIEHSMILPNKGRCWYCHWKPLKKLNWILNSFTDRQIDRQIFGVIEAPCRSSKREKKSSALMATDCNANQSCQKSCTMLYYIPNHGNLIAKVKPLTSKASDIAPWLKKLSTLGCDFQNNHSSQFHFYPLPTTIF